jgi:hypothetical protein
LVPANWRCSLSTLHLCFTNNEQSIDGQWIQCPRTNQFGGFISFQPSVHHYGHVLYGSRICTLLPPMAFSSESTLQYYAVFRIHIITRSEKRGFAVSGSTILRMCVLTSRFRCMFITPRGRYGPCAIIAILALCRHRHHGGTWSPPRHNSAALINGSYTRGSRTPRTRSTTTLQLQLKVIEFDSPNHVLHQFK